MGLDLIVLVPYHCLSLYFAKKRWSLRQVQPNIYTTELND